MWPSSGRFSRSDRLLAARDYRRVSRAGRRTACPDFVMLIATREVSLAPESDAPRLGIAASRKIGNAVMRNRVKRGVREWFRAHRDGLPRRADVVVIARRSAAGLSGAAIVESLGELGRRAAERS